MSILLGFRMALAGGREAAARMVLMAAGIAVGVAVLLLILTGLPLLQSHVDRLAWHRTTTTSPATAPDPAMWLAVTDRYHGRDVIRVHVAALGPRPPVPPGVDRLPGPGELVVSPALAELLRTAPADELGNRFPGRVVGTIRPEGLIAPGELVGIIGQTPEQMEKTHGAKQIRGIEQPGERLDLKEFWGILFGLLGVLIVGPVVVFISMATRIGGARREQRFAALRLIGATRGQTAVLAATEAGAAAAAGVLLGWLGFQALRPVVAGQVTLGHGTPIFVEDLRPPTGQALLVMAAVLVLAVATTLVALGPAQLTPLGVRQRVGRRRPSAWRLLPLALGTLGSWQAAQLGNDPAYAENPHPFLNLLTILAPLTTLVGLFLAGAWACMWISRGLARVSRGATMLIVARRIAADPYSAFRSVSGAALAIYVATQIGLVSAHERSIDTENRSLLDHGVVAVHVQGAPEGSLAPLMSGGSEVVVARLGAGHQIVVSCADLARVTEVTCPLPEEAGDHAARDMFRMEKIFNPAGFSEPGPQTPELRIQTLFIRTDGTAAAEERLRTLAAVTVPYSRSMSERDFAAQAAASTATWDIVLPPVIVLVLLIAACSLTVAAVNGVMERRRPFALLRASGVRLGQLRRIVLLETGAPLALTALGSAGIAMISAYAIVPRAQWVLPSAGFLASLAAGALAAFALTMIVLPILNVATRHDSVRFE